MESYVAANLYMEQGDKYDQDDLNNIQLLAEENARERRLQEANREVVDITVPVTTFPLAGCTNSPLG